MSPSLAIEVLQPAMEMVAQMEGSLVPASVLARHTTLLCEVFDKIRVIEGEYLEHGPRTREASDRLRSLFQIWANTACAIRDRSDWPLNEGERFSALDSRIDDAEEVLADFARGEAGLNRLAERFRTEDHD